MRPRGDSNLRGKAPPIDKTEIVPQSKLAKLFDLLCAAGLFLLAIAASMVIPKIYADRIWVYGTDLALLFSAMLNLLRIQNGYAVRGLKMFCVISNLAMLAFFVALISSIGFSRAVINAPVPLAAVLLLIETSFSLRNNA